MSIPSEAATDAGISPAVRTYAEFIRGRNPAQSLRAIVRDFALRALAVSARIDRTGDWIRFIYYHHVFDDERAGFARQLRDLGNHGEFVGADDAVSLLTGQQRFSGRYFCVGFDDGFKNCATGALPILAELGVPAVFYVPTDFVGARLDARDERASRVFGFRSDDRALEFLDWDDCRALAAAGMTIGSHSCSHPRFVALSPEDERSELVRSKARIETEVGVLCTHFCPPYGIPGVDFDPRRTPRAAREAGYASFATGIRGAMRPGDGPMALRRDHMLAIAGDHQHRYFLSRG